MERQEIYDKIQALLRKEKGILLKRFVVIGDLNFENYRELVDKRNQEYREWEIELMLSSDDELSERLAFIINADIDKF
jgi:hypothetical protein cdivTM_09561